MEMGRGGAYVPARVAPSRAHSSFIPSRMMRVFLLWKRRCADVRAGTQAPPLRLRLGGLHVNGYFVCMGLRGKIWWRLVGAVPMCPSVSPHKGASVVKFPAHNACIFGVETPLRGRSGGHTGAAPTVSFGWIACGTVDFVCVGCVEKYYGDG